MLMTYIDHLYLTSEQAEELISLMEDKYKVRSSTNFEILLNRVEDELLATADNTKAIIDETVQQADIQRVIDTHNEEITPEDPDNVKIVSQRRHGR